MFDFKRFKDFALTEYPSLKDHADKLYASFFSPYKLTLPRSDLERIEKFIKACFELRQSKAYQESLSSELKGFHNFRHYSVLMSYDFHLSETGPKLIEINTNAGFFLGLELLTRFHQTELSLKNIFSNARQDLFLSFENEHKLNTKKNIKKSHLAIVDQNLNTQDLYCEFLMYKDFFSSQGVLSQLADTKELIPKADGVYCAQNKMDFIYNRQTDFFFEGPQFRDIRNCLLTNEDNITLSPHPREYALLASKKRLVQWQKLGYLERLGLAHLQAPLLDCLVPSYNVQETDAEKLWNERKNLFFKPMESYGSKAAYAGRGITKKVFDHILTHPYLAQTLVPAPIFEAEDKSSFKYDLRVYVYQDQVQLIGARLYNGQTTNFKTVRGGFAPVLIV